MIASLAAVVAAFAWASAYVRDEAFFRFFGTRALFMAVTHEQMVFEGSLEQIGNLAWTAAIVWTLGLLWRYRNELGMPKLMSMLGLQSWTAAPLAILVMLIGMLCVLNTLVAAEKIGIKRARTFAVEAEAGSGWRTAVVKRFGEKRVVIEGYQLGCTEKACVLYRPGIEKTTESAPTAAGSTIHVTLDSSVCLISARAEKGAAPDCDSGT